MKKFFAIFLILPVIPPPLGAVSTLWTRTYGDGTTDLKFYSGAYDGEGHYVVVGERGDSAVILKVDTADGDVLWEVTLSGFVSGSLKGVAVDGGGSYVVVGDVRTSSGENEAVVARLNASDGSTLWVRTYGGGSYDYLRAVLYDPDGYYVAVGYTYTPDIHAWMLKLDTSGNVVWSSTYSTEPADRNELHSIVKDPEGYYVATGLTHVYLTNNGQINLLKVSTLTGDTVWRRTYGGDGWDAGYSVLYDPLGYYVVAGQDSAVRFSFLKVRRDGSVEWNRTYAGNGRSIATGILRRRDGSYFAVGHSRNYTLNETSLALWELEPSSGDSFNVTLMPSSPMSLSTAEGLLSEGDGYAVVGYSRGSPSSTFYGFIMRVSGEGTTDVEERAETGAVHLKVINGGVFVRARGEAVIYSPEGRRVRAITGGRTTFVPLNPGVYFVKTVSGVSRVIVPR